MPIRGERKNATANEQKFAKLLAMGFTPVEAARKTLNWRCETLAESQAARDLARAPRIVKFIQEMNTKAERALEAEEVSKSLENATIKDIRSFAFARLRTVRDDPGTKASIRLNAIELLERLYDPSTDINLIMKWIDALWRYAKAHCPACHKSFPLHKVQNKKLASFRKEQSLPSDVETPTDYDRRFELLKRTNPNVPPHPGQVKILSAGERHVLSTGAARSGKSALLAMLGTLGVMLPGVEIWIIARVYEDARSEVEYIQRALKTLFHPYHESLIRVYEDKKNGEFVMLTKWGTTLRVRSAKAKGSLTARALEMALCAEPGWLSDDIYEELRARMSERLGRIFAIGTPKGLGGFIGRMIRTTGRDKTGKMVRLTPEERLLKNGSPWNVSLLVTVMKPEENPQYVKSELEAARQELTDTEYASEFEGRAVAGDGMKFAGVTAKNLLAVNKVWFQNAVFVLGIDQGPINFGASLHAWDGQTAVSCYEFFESTEKTMKANLITLYKRVPLWIAQLGGNPKSWVLTIVDKHPPLSGTFDELTDEQMPWPTEIAERHRNIRRVGDNWRREIQEWINNMANNYVTSVASSLPHPRLLFHLADFGSSNDMEESPGCQLLHDQVCQVMDKVENATSEVNSEEGKGWVVRDAWRGDHVLDSWYFALWQISSGNIQMQAKSPTIEGPYIEARKAFEYHLARDEAMELGRNPPSFSAIFGRANSSEKVPFRSRGYSDEG